MLHRRRFFMEKGMLKKNTCCLISIFAVLLSGQVWAGNYSGGTGEPNNPFRICDANDMNEIGAHPNDWDKHFVLVNDINLAEYTGTEFNIIGTSYTNSFTGVFDGNSHTISNFTYSSTGTDYIGIFGCVKGASAKIKNLGLINSNVDAGTGDNIGSLVGYVLSGDINNCRVEKGMVSGHNYVSGIIGYNKGTVENCSSTATVSGFQYVGGVAGYLIGHLENTFYNGNVSGTAMVGGLVGYASASSITNCYAQGSASGSVWVGGLVGYGGGISYCYAASIISCSGISGGLVGDGSTLAYNSYWDTEVSGKDWSRAGTGKTTAEMQSVGTYFGWGYHPVWNIDDGNDYPRLIWENLPGMPIDDVLTDLLPGQGTEQDPFLVSTAEQLNSIGLCYGEWDKHFRLISDVNLAQCGTASFNIIGVDYSRPFAGVFDGNGHSISNLTINEIKRSYIGPFDKVDGINAQIKNLIVVDPNVIVIGSSNYVGSVVGSLSSGTVQNCFTVGGSIAGYNFVGGLVGSNGGEIIQSSFSGTCSGNLDVGGLVGANAGIIRNSLAESSVYAEESVGGLAGVNGHLIMNSYCEGMVTGDSDVGGLVGVNAEEIFDSYSATAVVGNNGVGGLVGSGSGVVYNSNWDVNTSGLATSEGGTGLTTEQMYDKSSFPNWGCDAAWKINDGNDYPRLYWEDTEGEVLGCEFPWPGSGTSSDPFLITSEERLAALAVLWHAWDKHYRVMADLDLAALPTDDWNVIAPSAAFAFSGVFEGNGHRISNLKCLTAKQGLAGLFGCLDGPPATIQDVVLIDPNVSVSYGDGIGSLVGEVKSGKILRCAVLGAELTLTGLERTAGGLVGVNSGEISECSADAVVLGTCGYICGGGGLVASNHGQVYDCYASGEIAGGGLVGMNTGLVSNCYSAAIAVETGGLVELNYGDVLSSFWDVNSSGATTSAGGTGLTTTEMQMWGSYEAVGWDFNDVWNICEGTGYPKLIWQIPAADYLCPDGVDFIDYSFLADHWMMTDYGDCNGVDLTGDGIVNNRDFSTLASYWGLVGCGSCGGVDYTGDGNVLYDDLAILANSWLITDYGDVNGAEITGDGKIDWLDLRYFTEQWLVGIE